MSRPATPDTISDPQQASQAMLENVQKPLGSDPNVCRMLATGPEALEGSLRLNGDLASVRAAGYPDAEIIEMIGLIAVNVLTNYLDQVSQTAIDFPAVEATSPA